MKRILLAATGLTPQIVTETLYALCVTQEPRWIPHEVHLITSVEGEKRARLDLLDPRTGQFHAFCRDYPQAKDIKFEADDRYIHVMDARLDDVRTPEANALAANAIHDLVRKLTKEDENEVHVSLAGGRKTMGFYLGYCLSLYARQHDKLSHVLVSKDFERVKEIEGFYFPPKEPKVLHTWEDGRPIETSDAKVMLAEIPFVRMRQLLPGGALNPAQTFSDVVAATQSHLETAKLTIEVSKKILRCGNRRVTDLPPRQLAFYLWFADRAKRMLPPVCINDNDKDMVSELLDCYALIADVDGVGYKKAVAKLEKEKSIPNTMFYEARSKINRKLKKEFTRDADPLARAAAPYLVASNVVVQDVTHNASRRVIRKVEIGSGNLTHYAEQIEEREVRKKIKKTYYGLSLLPGAIEIIP
jgi:CRISPR-associated protein (TIGR02584 family)